MQYPSFQENDITGLISGAIIYNQQFKVGERLSEDAFNTFPYILGPIIHRYTYGYRKHSCKCKGLYLVYSKCSVVLVAIGGHQSNGVATSTATDDTNFAHSIG